MRLANTALYTPTLLYRWTGPCRNGSWCWLKEMTRETPTVGPMLTWRAPMTSHSTSGKDDWCSSVRPSACPRHPKWFPTRGDFRSRFIADVRRDHICRLRTLFGPSAVEWTYPPFGWCRAFIQKTPEQVAGWDQTVPTDRLDFANGYWLLCAAQ